MHDWRFAAVTLKNALSCRHRDYGGNLRFSGRVATVKCYENNPLVRQVWSAV